MIFDNFFINYIMSMHIVLLVILISSELKSLANNAKIRSLLKYLLIQYFMISVPGEVRIGFRGTICVT